MATPAAPAAPAASADGKAANGVAAPAAPAALAGAAGARTTQIVFLSVNDVYESEPNADGVGGLPSLATMIARERERIRQETPSAHSLLTVNGDFMSASALAMH